jgi:hypothetical protein
MKRDSDALKLRTKDFGLRVLRLYRSLPLTFSYSFHLRKSSAPLVPPKPKLLDMA